MALESYSKTVYVIEGEYKGNPFKGLTYRKKGAGINKLDFKERLVEYKLVPTGRWFDKDGGSYFEQPVGE